MGANLQEKLAAIDPATLEAGPETDALVAGCVGWRNVRVQKSFDGDTLLEAYPVGNNPYQEMSISSCATPVPHYSTNPVDAFFLWPWLLERNDLLSLQFYGSTLAVIEDIPGKRAVSVADTWALALCRAVVAVAKEQK